MPTTESEQHVLPVLEVDAQGGAFLVQWPDGKRLRMRLPANEPVWKQLRVGARVLVTRESVAGGKPRYKAKLVEGPHPSTPPGVPPGSAQDALSMRTPGSAQDAQSTHAPVSAQDAQITPAASALPAISLEPILSPDMIGGAGGFDRAKAEAEKPIHCPEVGPLFAQAGPVARLLGDRYRPRPGQVRMAELVRTALVEKRHAVLEAGTGVGKSFAYLLPVVWSGAGAIASTSNKALMSQLWHKDIPALRRIAPKPFTAALLKGRGNYVCALKLEELRSSQRTGSGGEYRIIRDRLRDVPTGDVEEMGLRQETIGRLTVRRHECEGRKCSEYGNCFYERAKLAAQEATLVVTNHALVCQSALVNANRILPVRPVLIVDEAHELETYAISAMTRTLDSRSVDAIVRHPLARSSVTPELQDAAVEWNAQLFGDLYHQHRERRGAWALRGEIQSGLRLWDTLRKIATEVEAMPVPRHEEGKRDRLFLLADETATTVHALAQPEPDNYIRYCGFEDADSAANGDFTVYYRPLEVDAVLRQALWNEWPRVITTSATLGMAGDLNWFQRRVGLPPESAPITGTLRSPFDYRQQVLLYTPVGPEPAYQGEPRVTYEKWLQDEVLKLVLASRGRAFVLCTSRGRMERLHDELAPRIPYPCFCQGRRLSRPQLLDEFRDAANGVLFGTRSFWEGVDIPGEALSLVILDKIPFLPTEDPVFQRQEKLIEARGGNSFQELQLGSAILTLRQGAGRLMRSEDDGGVIAILDSRIRTARYGETILRSLPDGRVTTRFEEVAAFFAKH